MKRVGLIKSVMMAAVAVGLGAGAMQARASTLVFAAFTELGSPALNYSNASGELTGTVSAYFDNQLAGVIPYFGTTTLSFSAIRTVGVAGDVVVNGVNISQEVSGELAFTNGSTNVLDVIFSGAVLAGFSNTGHINADTLVGDAIAYTSDYVLPADFFLPFSFSIALSTKTPLELDASNSLNNLKSFTASATGTFTENQPGGDRPTPLPAAVWGGLGMMGALGGIRTLIRRRRR